MAVTSMRHATRTERVPYRLSIEAAGALTLLLGAWGALVPYIGPLFSFSGDGSSSWSWNLAHSLLFLVPGAAALFAGLVVLIEGYSSSPARRTLLAFGGILAAICGAWFVIGPLAWPALQGRAFFVSATPLQELEYWIGYSLGPGGLLLAFGAFILGRPRTIGTSLTIETMPLD